LSDWRHDIIAQLGQYSGTSDARRWSTLLNVEALNHDGIPGDIVECGVWQGGQMMIAKAVCRHMGIRRRVWLFDTFAGMTEPGPEDTKVSGTRAIDRYNKWKERGIAWKAASLPFVRDLFAAYDLLDDDVLFVEGRVEETLLRPDLPERIALLRLDTDWYASTKVELEVLWPRVVTWGVLVVDDYGHWQGCARAVDEYFGRAVEMEIIDYTARRLVKA